MRTFKSTDPRFDDIEYWFVTEPWGTREASYIVYLNCDGSKHRSARIYRDQADAEAHLTEDLSFDMKYWAEQLDDRRRAVVCEGTHYRYNAYASAPPAHRGFGGRAWLFNEIGSDEFIASSDVWYQGIIPVWARKAFPDTHTLG